MRDGGLGIACGGLGHDETDIAVLGDEQLAVAFLADAFLVGLGGVEEANAAFEGFLDGALDVAFLEVADVPAADAEHGDSCFGGAQFSQGQ